jgi:hypothetical protein
VHPFALFILAALIVVWIYLRRVASRGRLHGRDLWRVHAKRLRRRWADGAQTWEERRRRIEARMVGWRSGERHPRRDAAHAAHAPKPDGGGSS